MAQVENVGRKGPRGELLPEAHDGLPDSRYRSGLCPRCGKQSSFDPHGSIPITTDGRFAVGVDGTRSTIELDHVTVLVCRHCNQGVAVIEERAQEDLAPGQRPTTRNVYWRGIHWWPLPDTQLPDAIPSEIAGAFAEAAMALHANCPRASAVMARRTLEAIAIDKGEVSGSLAQRLRNLADKGVLHPSLTEWAHEVRLVGNDGAHGDVINPVSIEDARDLIGFVRELLRYLYELPADLARRRASK